MKIAAAFLAILCLLTGLTMPAIADRPPEQWSPAVNSALQVACTQGQGERFLCVDLQARSCLCIQPEQPITDAWRTAYQDAEGIESGEQPNYWYCLF